jgi:hypothetical protein
MKYLVLKFNKLSSCLKVKLLLHSYLTVYLKYNGLHTTNRVDFIRINDNMFKISCDNFYSQVANIVSKICIYYNIKCNKYFEEREIWK